MTGVLTKVYFLIATLSNCVIRIGLMLCVNFGGLTTKTEHFPSVTVEVLKITVSFAMQKELRLTS